MHKVNRHKLDGSKATVDPPNQLVNVAPQVLVLLYILTRGNSYLDEDNLADPFWVLVEEDLHGVQLLRHSLDVVETIHTDDDLDAVETTTEGRDAVDDRLALEALYERGSASGLATAVERLELTSRNCEGSMPMGKVPTVA